MRPISVIQSLLLFALLPAVSYGADGIDFSAHIDWNKNTLRIEASADISDAGNFIPTARRKTEQLMDQELPYRFRDALAAMVVDSYYTAGELAEDSPELVRAINDLTYRNEKTFSRISSDLKNFSITYTYSFYPDIINIFIKHNRPYKPNRQLQYTPTAEFSGIVIYMKDTFPVHGEMRDAQLVPALFPRIFDQSMDLIYEKGMVDPAHLRKWGMAVYSEELDETPYRERIGDNPLRVLGRGIFGKNRTDIIIDEETAQKILYSPHNRNLLAEGRVMIICEL